MDAYDSSHGTNFRGATTLRPSSGSVYLGLAVTLLVVSGGFVAGYFTMTGDDAISEAEAAHSQVAHVAPEVVERAIAQHLTSPATVRIGERSESLAWSQLGVIADGDEMARAAALLPPEVAGAAAIVAALREHGALPLSVDRAAAVARLSALKSRHDTSPEDARMDLEKRIIHPSRDGTDVDLYASLAAIETAARSGATEVVLHTVALPAKVSTEGLGIDDISQVLAHFETEFSTSDFARNYNLKLAASKLNGYVLQPGVEFSFNDVVGARTEKEGYKIAHVITAGEMVDGLAGGTCQISTTLHGAAFFAGIEVLKAIPHSRPSTYVTMGLDATVVYPQVDLVLRNGYDFPVAIHYKVNRGRSYVEILGKERPYDKVVFERKVTEKLDFDTITREDDTMPVGSMTVDQYGFFGYKVDRLRKFYKDGKVVKKNRWPIRYAPVTEYARLGTNPDPNLVAPNSGDDKHKKKRLKEPGTKIFRLSQ